MTPFPHPKMGANSPGIRVCLRDGLYFLREPLTLSPQDASGNAPITWIAYPNERPILSGGQLLTDWKPTTINGRDAWVAKIPGGDQAVLFRELWLDGKRLIRTRWPYRGTLELADSSAASKSDEWSKGSKAFHYLGDDLKAWPNVADGEVIVASRWVESHLPIESIDEVRHVVHCTKTSVFRMEPGDRYWIENVRQSLTEPGEFYVDPREKAVYLIPPTGVDPDHAQIIAPRLAQVLRLEGNPAAGKFVERLTFQGVGFANTEWYFDRDFVAQQAAGGIVDKNWILKPDPTRSGYPQAEMGVPGAISGIGLRSCRFDRCEISNIGTYGIELSEGCQHNQISRCNFNDLGAGAVKIGEVGFREDTNEQTFGNEVSDCTISDGGNLFPSCVAVWIGQSHDNVIAHNDIHGFWYTAISVGWTWGYGRSGSEQYHRIQPHSSYRHEGRWRGSHSERHGRRLHTGEPGGGRDPLQQDSRYRGIAVRRLGHLFR